MKKVLSLVLAIAMVFSSMSFAFAGTFEDVTDEDVAQAVDALSALGIVNGNPDGTYKPEAGVTRGEMVKLLVVALGHGDLAKDSKSAFSDSQGKWYDGYAAVAQALGITNGTGAGKFSGDAQIKYTEVITMVMRALGYNDRAVNANRENVYNATSYKTTAARLGVLKGVDFSSNTANRGDVALMVYNSLEVQVVVPNEDGNPVGQWLIAPALGSSGVVRTLLDDVAKRDGEFEVTVAQLNNGHVADLSQYLGETVVAYKNHDNKVIFVKESLDLVTKGEIDSMDDVSITVLLSDDTTVKRNIPTTTGGSVSSKVGVIVNRYSVSDAVLTSAGIDSANLGYVIGTGAGDSIKIVRNGDTGAVENIIVEDALNLIKVNAEYKEGQNVFSGIKLPLDKYSKVNFNRIIVEGAASALSDIEKNDVVQVYPTKDNSFVKFVVTREVIEDTVKTVDIANNALYTMDGTKYSLNTTNGTMGISNMRGYAYTFYLDKDGMIAFAVKGNSSSAIATEYGIITAYNPGKVSRSFGIDSVTTYPKVKVTGLDGKVKVYEVAVTVNKTGALDTTPVGFKTELGATDSSIINILATSGVATGFATQTTNHMLVEFGVDDDGRIVEIAAPATVTGRNVKTSNANFRADSNTVILNGEDDYAPVALDKIGSQGLDYVAVMNGATWDLLIVTDGLDSNTVKTYGVIKAINDTVNTSGKRVKEVVVLVNGESKSFLSTTDSFTATKNTLLELTINAKDEISGTIAAVATSGSAIQGGASINSNNSKVVSLDGNLLVIAAAGQNVTDLTKSAYFTLSDEVAIYGVKAGRAPAIRSQANLLLANPNVPNSGSNVSLYDNNDDGVIDVIIIHE